MTDAFIDTTEKTASCGCNGWNTSDDSDDNGTSSIGSGSKRRDPPVFSTQRLFKLPRRMFTGDNQHSNDVAEVDIAKEFKELTFQEREKVMDELHGVAEIPIETPEFVEESLKAMDRAIKKVPKRKRKALEKAFFLRPSFASDSKFKLLFLRAEEFDAANAAKRMVAYFEAKRTLFGDDKLAKIRITLDDLTADDIRFIFYSQFFGFPKTEPKYTDASGRPIRCYTIPNFDFDNICSAFRGVWYVAMSKILPQDDDEEETATAGSIKGFCNILYIPSGSVLKSSLSKFVEVGRHVARWFLDAVPSRLTSMHLCCSEPAMQVPMSVIQKFIGKRARVRMRVHYGTPIEIRYALLPFGIRCPPHVISIAQPGTTTSSSNDNETEEMNQYLERRREIERRRESTQQNREIESGILLYPRHPKDVLIGRGTSYKDHPGNQYHQDMVGSRLEEYIAATNFEKTCISMEVVQTIRGEGGMFLTLLEGVGWKILDTAAARDKTSNSFRSKINHKQKTSAKQQGDEKW